MNVMDTHALDRDVLDTEVLIVGAGPTGLTLGVDLARRGVDALVLEGAAELLPGLTGQGLRGPAPWRSSTTSASSTRSTRWAPYPVGMIWRDGERVGEHDMFDPAEPSEDSPYNRAWMVPQWRTQRSWPRGWRNWAARWPSATRSPVSRRTRTASPRTSPRAARCAPATWSRRTAAGRRCAARWASA